mgnify:FL=1
MRGITYHLVQSLRGPLYHGNYSILRQLANGNWVGYDAKAHRNDEQVHFAIRGSGDDDLQRAFADSRKYNSMEDAVADLALNGLEATSTRTIEVWGLRA